MGNWQTANDVDQQADAFFTALPEDIMILLTKMLCVKDFVHLNTTCKYYYYQLLGPNNILWAQTCYSLRGANRILKELQFLDQWKAVNKTEDRLDLTHETDLTSKRLLRFINFKNAISNYYLLIINNRKLRQRLAKFVLVSSIYQPVIKAVPFSLWTNFSEYWTRVNMNPGNFIKDYFYEVDLEHDPISVEKAFSSSIAGLPEFESISRTLPSMQSGRLVVYKKSKAIAQSTADWRDLRLYLGNDLNE